MKQNREIPYLCSSNQVQVYNVHNFHEIFDHPAFVRERSTVIYHYGFTQTPETPSVVEVIQAYLTFDNVNVVLVNYASLTTNTLPVSCYVSFKISRLMFSLNSQNACTIGENLASAVVRLFDRGYSPARLHLVGFSFGSTVFGIVGREVIAQSNANYMIERITGLDPGQVQNLLLPLTGRLNPGDARFVETIHTEAVGFGDLEARGHVQYFVNGGIAQPMCNSAINTVAQTCSHLFASTIWVESIRAQSAIFPALHCLSWEHFLRNDCIPGAPIGNLGVVTSTALRGSYFLRTNNVAPFSRPVPGP